MVWNNMEFNPNKTNTEVLREGSFHGTLSWNIYTIVNYRWYNDLWKEFRDSLSDIDLRYYSYYSHCYRHYYSH